MPGITVTKTPIAQGAGYLYRAAIGTSLPTNSVTGSVFDTAWAAAWKPLGVTKEGSEFGYEVTTDTIDSAEYFDPLQIVVTARAATLKAELQIVSATFLAWALNMAAASATSGSGTTLMTTVQPPAPGAEVRCMLGWESQDNTERLVMEQAFQAGTLAISRKKGADNATIACEWHAEVAASGYPFQHFFAGAARG